MTSIEAGDRRLDAQVDRLLATAVRVTESLDLETVLAAIVDDARTLLRADSGDMLLWYREQDRLRVAAVSKQPMDLLDFEMAYRHRRSSRSARSGSTTTRRTSIERAR